MRELVRMSLEDYRLARLRFRNEVARGRSPGLVLARAEELRAAALALAEEMDREARAEERASRTAPQAPAFAPGREIGAGGDREPSGAEIVRLQGKEDA